MRRVNTLIAFVVGYAVQHFWICPTLVVPVDDFTHQPEFRILFLTEIVNTAEEIKVYAICCVEPNSIDVEGIHPVTDCINQVIAHVPVAQVQLNQIIVTVPAFIPERIAAGAGAAEVQSGKPITVRGSLSLFLYIPERPEIPSNMVEHTVQNNTNAIFVQHITNMLKQLIGSQTIINHLIVCCIIAVFY